MRKIFIFGLVFLLLLVPSVMSDNLILDAYTDCSINGRCNYISTPRFIKCNNQWVDFTDNLEITTRARIL